MINYYDRATTHPEIFKQLSCKEILFVNYDCPIETKKQDKWSHYNYILYVVTGKKAIHTNGRSFLLTQGSIVFVKKGACIIEKFFEEVLCLVAFFIPDDYLRSFLRENRSIVQNQSEPAALNDLVIPLERNEMILGYYESIMPYFDAIQKPHEDLLELKFRELLFNIVANPANNVLSQYLQTLLLPQRENLQSIIETNCHFNLKLEDYARLCNRSLSSFKRDFQKVFGAAPASWLLSRRIEQACQLLLNTSKSVSDVAFESGFEDSTHFSRVFKSRYGFSPLQYRNKTNMAVTLK